MPTYNLGPCDNCCDVTPCNVDAVELYVSGICSCTLTRADSIYVSWFNAPVGLPCGGLPGCQISLQVECSDGLLKCTVSLENYGPVMPVYVSQNPILITVTVPATPGCSGGTITISE